MGTSAAASSSHSGAQPARFSALRHSARSTRGTLPAASRCVGGVGVVTSARASAVAAINNEREDEPHAAKYRMDAQPCMR